MSTKIKKKIEKIRFGTIYETHLFSDNLSPFAKLVYSCLSIYAGNKSICWPSWNAIAKNCGISLRSVNYAIRELEKAGIIITKRTNKASIYEIILPKRHAGGALLTERHAGGALLTNQTRTTCASDTQEVRINNNIEDKHYKKEEREKKFAPPTLEEFIQYFIENKFSKESATRAWNGYNVAGWKDSTGKKIKNWKQKAIHVWFTPENRINSQESGSSIYKPPKNLLQFDD